MKPLFSTEEYNSSKSTDKLPCECYICKNKFFREKKELYRKNRDIKYCSKNCQTIGYRNKITVTCLNCKKEFNKKPFEVKKSDKHFCSQNCFGTYSNLNKTTGTRRSKLEMYLENKLTELYPDIEFHFNRKDAINSELDIYIPAMKLAFELNGIFHYEPIYGSDKLLQIQNNDNRKFQACLEQDIEFCIIDTSSQKYFKEHTSKKFLDVISNIIFTKTLLLPFNGEHSNH